MRLASTTPFLSLGSMAQEDVVSTKTASAVHIAKHPKVRTISGVEGVLDPFCETLLHTLVRCEDMARTFEFNISLH